MDLKALLIGSGNIAVGYNDPTYGIATHAGAFQHFNIPFDIFDPDILKAQKAAELFNAGYLGSINNINLDEYKIVSICSPTPTHAHYLELLLSNKTPVIICEKPVSNDLTELNDLEKLYDQNNSAVIVNYIRRFQPAYQKLKNELKHVLESEVLKEINIMYCRGFLNNCSHALDILEFLFDIPASLDTLIVSKSQKDAFPDDPTISAKGKWMNAILDISGISSHSFVFEIVILFSQTRLFLRNSGLEIHSASRFEKIENPLLNYMLPVVKKAISIKGKNEDNFKSSLEINKKIKSFLSDHEQACN